MGCWVDFEENLLWCFCFCLNFCFGCSFFSGYGCVNRKKWDDCCGLVFIYLVSIDGLDFSNVGIVGWMSLWFDLIVVGMRLLMFVRVFDWILVVGGEKEVCCV